MHAVHRLPQLAHELHTILTGSPVRVLALKINKINNSVGTAPDPCEHGSGDTEYLQICLPKLQNSHCSE